MMAVVTGIGSGVGRRAAELLSDQNDDVVGWELRGVDIDSDISDPVAVGAATRRSRDRHEALARVVSGQIVHTGGGLPCTVPPILTARCNGNERLHRHD